jgi:dolichol-phosphate mannosyltransferase
MADGEGSRELGLLSVVVPVYNEAETIGELYERVTAAVEDLPFELILSDNCSTDGTEQALRELAARDQRVRVVFLSRNFGHQASLTAALSEAQGDAIVMLDGDLQDPPELIPRMVERWRAGAEVVSMVRTDRPGETRFKRWSARWFYRVLNRLTELDVPQNAGDFRLLSRRALDALLSMPERSRFLRGMSVWIGFRQEQLTYRRDPRHAGETKYPLRRLLRFSLDGIASFSDLPLRVATAVGFAVSALALLGLPLVIGFRIAGYYLPGISSLLLAVLFLGGVQLITIGIIGEYLARVYDEVKQRPLFLVREKLNASEGAEDREAREGPPTQVSRPG